MERLKREKTAALWPKCGCLKTSWKVGVPGKTVKTKNSKVIASPVWDSCTKADALALERLQLSVARAIVKKGRRVASNSAVLEMIGWPTLAWRRRRLKLVLLWKLMHGHGPPALRAQLPTCVSVRAKQSLRRDTLAMPLCRTQRRLQSFRPSTVAIWNSLPSSVLSCTSVSSFLVSLDSHLISDRYSLGL